MCLAFPLQVIAVDGPCATVLEGGEERVVGLELVETVRVGQYVLVHAGFAVQVLDPADAEETLRLIREAYGFAPP